MTCNSEFISESLFRMEIDPETSSGSQIITQLKLRTLRNLPLPFFLLE